MVYLTKDQFEQIQTYTSYQEYIVQVLKEYSRAASGSYSDHKSRCCLTICGYLLKELNITFSDLVNRIESTTGEEFNLGWLSPADLTIYDFVPKKTNEQLN